jgi:hypothetical protein
MIMINTTIAILTEAECADLADRVAELRRFWIDRYWGWTLGAATYQDDPKAYPALANYTNVITAQAFDGLYRELSRVLSKLMYTDIVTLEGTALPAFHIFTDQSNGFQGHPHIDEPFTRIDWNQEVTDPFSFTMALALPKCGGGMHYWPDHSDSDIEAYESKGELPAHETIAYTVGELYVHDGLTPHRIANFGNMLKDEARITLQGHGVTLADGNIAIYF